MNLNLFFSLSAVAALVPAAVMGLRGIKGRTGTFWLLLAVALAGPAMWLVVHGLGTWHTGLASTLWVAVTVSLVIFLALSAITRQAWRLAPLLLPYLLVLGLLATVWQAAPGAPLSLGVASGWLGVHIAVSVVTYGLVTIAAVAALAAFLQERALKRKRPNSLTHQLPSVADSERLVVRLLIAGEVVLGLGMVTGMAGQYTATGAVIEFDHKTLLSLAAFAVIGGLLGAHYLTGVRGRAAARLVLLAYLLLTLGYLGVKFVTDVLVG